jgi:FAD dependent oxidoreductase
MEDTIMKTVVEPQKEVPVLSEAQVVVVGGGPAGIGAALSSARTGAETVLIDRFGSLGGLQTQGNNSIFSFVDPALHGGIIAEILERLAAAAQVSNPDTMSDAERAARRSPFTGGLPADKLPKRLVETAVGYWGRWGRYFDAEYYKYLLDEMIAEAGVKPLYHSFAAAAIREGDSLKGVIIETKEGRRAVLGKVVIDTTGQADIAWKSGAPVLGDEGFPVGPRKGHPGGMLHAFFIAGVDLPKFREFRRANPAEWGAMYGGRRIIKEAREKGAHLKSGAVIISADWDLAGAGRVYIMNPVHAVPVGRTGWMTEEMTDCEIDLRKQAWAIWQLLKEKVPGFEKSFVEKTPQLCTFPGHRILGEHIVTVGEMREGKAFDDAIAINNMPPDIYEAVGRFRYEILPHDIPYGALVSKGIDNLLGGGMTVSSGPFAMAGLRYCTPSICTGQAAGTAAALAARNNVSPKRLDVKLLQNSLRKQGARVSVKDVAAEALEPYQFIQKLGIMWERTPGAKIDVTEEEIGRY